MRHIYLIVVFFLVGCSTAIIPPPGFTDYCQRFPVTAECGGEHRSSDNDVDIGSVNTRINSEVTYVDDSFQYGKSEFWADAAMNGRVGDCEDYALAKLHALLELGVNISRMGFAVCRAPTGPHLVLLVDEVLVLDSRTNSMIPVDCTLIAVQIPGTQRWIEVSKK